MLNQEALVISNVARLQSERDAVVWWYRALVISNVARLQSLNNHFKCRQYEFRAVFPAIPGLLIS